MISNCWSWFQCGNSHCHSASLLPSFSYATSSTIQLMSAGSTNVSLQRRSSSVPSCIHPSAIQPQYLPTNIYPQSANLPLPNQTSIINYPARNYLSVDTSIPLAWIAHENNAIAQISSVSSLVILDNLICDGVCMIEVGVGWSGTMAGRDGGGGNDDGTSRYDDLGLEGYCGSTCRAIGCWMTRTCIGVWCAHREILWTLDN